MITSTVLNSLSQTIAAIPLTTTFTPPAVCFQPTYTLDPMGVDSWAGHATIVRGYAETCFPSGYKQAMINSAAVTSAPGLGVVAGSTSYLQYFSPGVCPSGYRTIEQVTSETVTLATCCPSYVSMTYDSVWGACKLVPMPMDLTVSGIDSLDGGYPVSTIDAGGGGAIESAVTVAWQVSDLSLLGRATPTSLLATPTPSLSQASALNSASASNPTATVATPTSGVQPATSISNATPTTGITAATAAGIGVGAAAAFALVFLVIAYYRRRRRAASYAAQAAVDSRSDDDANHGQWKAELGADERSIYEKSGESASYPKMPAHGAQSPRELGAEFDGAAHEMPNRNTVLAELDGDWRGWEAPPVPEKGLPAISVSAKPRDSNMF